MALMQSMCIKYISSIAQDNIDALLKESCLKAEQFEPH